MSTFWPIFVKETLHIIRDKRSLVAAIALPVFMLLVFGFAISLDVRQVDIAVIDRDHSVTSRDMLAALTADQAIRVVARPVDERQMERLLDKSIIRLGVVIPPGFGEDIGASKNAPVQVVVDGTDATFASLSLAYVGGSLQDQVRRQIGQTLKSYGLPITPPGLVPQPRIFFNEALDSRWFVVPALIAIIILQLSALLTSQCVAREYERNTIEQILVSPVSGPSLIFGKLCPYIVIGGIQVSTVVALSYWVFGVPIRGSFLLLGVATFLFLTGSLALGLTLSSRLKNQALAMQVSMVATMLPSLILSGFMFPIANMPRWLQIFSYVVPARYYVAITRGLFLKGVGVDILWPELLAMVIYAAVLLVVAIRGFKGRLT